MSAFGHLPDPYALGGEGRLVDEEVQRTLEALSRGLSELARLLAVVEDEVPGAIRRGTGTITFPASAISNALVVNHGLGATPAAVVCTRRAGTATGVTAIHVTAQTATTFTVAAVATAAQVAGATLTFFWMASA